MSSALVQSGSRIAGPVAVIVLGFIVFAVYAPGQNGDFVLDDYANISPLILVAEGSDGLLRYLFSDIYANSNRWLSKLSFLIDTPTWPAEATRFKLNNILIHILNGLLVIWFLLRLMRMLGHSEGSSQIVSLLVGGIWLLHPLNVSTVLYVVQRMTELSALFCLIGLLLYLAGRNRLTHGQPYAYLLMSFGVVACSILAFLSKENGALLPLYILVLDSLLLRGLPHDRSFKVWKSVFLVLPSTLILAWLIYELPEFAKMGNYRPFDLWERLMSEARILIDYLRLILIPTRTGTGVYHDDFEISRGLFSPPTTLLCIILVMGLLITAFAVRKRFPVLCFGIIWFFAGHLLESTVVPLELYFEHRNYLPMLGPLFALCYYALTTPTRIKRVIATGVGLFLVFTTISTIQNVRIWSNLHDNLATWQKEHPESPRMMQYASNLYVRMGEYDKSEAVLKKFVALKPEWAGPKLKLLLLSCASGENRLDRDIEDLISSLETAEYEPVSPEIVKNLFKGMKKKPCSGLNMEHIGQMLEKLIKNPEFRKHGPELAKLYSTRAQYNEFFGDHHLQALDLNESYRWRRNHYVALAESEVWAALGELDNALDAVRKAKANYYVYLQGFKFYFDSNELDQWENTLLRIKNEREQRS